MFLCKIFAVSGGYLAKFTWFGTALNHSSTLISPWQNLVKISYLALSAFVWGLQNSSNFFYIISKHSSSCGKHHEMYWSNPKSPDHAITFLHFLASGNITNSYSSMFSHLIFHFKNLWYRWSFTVQSIWVLLCRHINLLDSLCLACRRLWLWSFLHYLFIRTWLM